jgi:hypothetical protein
VKRLTFGLAEVAVVIQGTGFCTTALFTWKLDATDVSRMAGHANYRITLGLATGGQGLA